MRQNFQFDENGYLPLKKGWWKDPATEAWYYIKPSLSCETGWRQLGKNWYFFDRCTGRMADWGTYDTRGAFSQKPDPKHANGREESGIHGGTEMMTCMPPARVRPLRSG